MPEAEKDGRLAIVIFVLLITAFTVNICLAPPLSTKIFDPGKRVSSNVATPTTFKLVVETVTVPVAFAIS